LISRPFNENRPTKFEAFWAVKMYILFYWIIVPSSLVSREKVNKGEKERNKFFIFSLLRKRNEGEK
jgi:hypothetical protein